MLCSAQECRDLVSVISALNTLNSELIVDDVGLRSQLNSPARLSTS